MECTLVTVGCKTKTGNKSTEKQLAYSGKKWKTQKLYTKNEERRRPGDTQERKQKI
jgi:hypothetical protein